MPEYSSGRYFCTAGICVEGARSDPRRDHAFNGRQTFSVPRWFDPAAAYGQGRVSPALGLTWRQGAALFADAPAGRVDDQRVEMISLARCVPLEQIIEQRVIKLRGRIERVGPCPRCGGTDRFSINTRKQLFNCRGCRKGGDVIELVKFLDGTSFRGACKTLTSETSSAGTGFSRPAAQAGATAQYRGLRAYTTRQGKVPV